MPIVLFVIRRFARCWFLLVRLVAALILAVLAAALPLGPAAAPFRLAGSGLFWPDLGASRIANVTPSQGFAPDRQASQEADLFRITLDPGAVVTFVAELRTADLPQLYLWDADTYKDTVNSYTLYRGIVLGISGLLALFLTIVFVVKGTAMFPATAALAWSVLIYLCID